MESEAQLPAPYSPERLADRAQIADLLARYCRSVDRLDYEAMAASYHPDATDDHGGYAGGVEGFVDYVRDRHRGMPFSMHQTGNQLIEFTGRDEAVVETYVLTYQTYGPDHASALAVIAGLEVDDDETRHFLLSGRYVDVVTRRDEEWRFQTRRAVYDSGVVFEGVVTAPGPAFITGARDRTDPIYQALADRGGAAAAG